MDRRVGVMMIAPRVGALRSVDRLLALSDRPAIVAVDDGSSDEPWDRTPVRAFRDAPRVLAQRRVPSAGEARPAALDGRRRRSRVPAERRGLLPAVEARRAALDGSKPRFRLRRYVG